MHVKVLRIVYILVRPGLDSIDDTRFQVDQNRAGDVSRVVALVVENVLAVTALGRKVLEISITADAMFLAKLLPELASD